MSRTSALLFAASLLTLVAAPGCSKGDAPAPTNPTSTPTSAAAAGLPDRDPALAHDLVAKGALLLDVRTVDEYSDKHLDKAVNVPVDELDSRLAEIEKLSGGDKSKPIVVYCQAGGRAARAKKSLLAAGFSQVTNLGGIADWDKK